MLRYKNSLLERILLEKGKTGTNFITTNIGIILTFLLYLGIDVQAELRAKTGSPTLGPTHIPQNLVQPPPIHRTILNRHQSRRPASTIAPKIEPGVSTFSPTVQPQSVVSSPKNQKTSSNQSHSPATTGTPTYGSQIANPASVATDAIGLRAPMGMKPIAMSSASRPTAMTSAPGLRSDGTEPFYPTPSFQNHMDQLGKLTRLLSLFTCCKELWRPRFIPLEQNRNTILKPILSKTPTPKPPDLAHTQQPLPPSHI